MLTTRKAPLLLVATGLLSFGCNDSNRSPTAPSRLSVGNPTLDAARSERAARDKQKITGHAYFVVINEGNVEEEYALDAKTDQDALQDPLFTSAHGNLLYGSDGKGGFKIHAEMYCFKIVSNRANLAARVKKSTNPNVREGDYLVWRIEDNDKAEHRLPDRTTQLFLADKAAATDFCAFGGDPTHPFFPVKGNLEIRETEK